MLEISCAECGAAVCHYQKDGPGSLKRMYLDRIADSQVPIAGKALKCHNGHLLGTEIIYKKENRPAFRLITDAVRKKIIKSP